MVKYITPAVTPLNADGTIDAQGLKSLYDFLIRGGTDGILALGSIGEFFALTMEQKKDFIKQAVRCVDGRVPLIIGTGDTVMEHVTELSSFAIAEGADAVIAVPPYYFPLSAESIEKYYDTLAQSISGKLYLYNFPDRTGYEIPAEVIRRLALRHPNIVGCKDSVSGMNHTRETIKAVKPERPDFEIYSGFDDHFAHNALSGGDGCIGGLFNVAPEICRAWRDAVNHGDLSTIGIIQRKIDRLMDIYAVGVPFVPFIKRAMELRGVGIRAFPAAPLRSPSQEDDRKLMAIMKREGILTA